MPITLTMPALSPTMEEGTLAKWLVGEGDKVSAGDAIAEIETDKATMEFECIDEGTVGKILVPEGTEGVKVNEPIMILLEEGEDASAIDAAAASSPAPQEAAAPAAPAASASTPAAAPQAAAAPAATAVPSGGGDRIFASPLAKRMAKDGGLDISTVSGTGPRGRIVKKDVEAALAAPRPAAAASAAPTAGAKPTAPSAPAPAMSGYEPDFELESLSNVRKTIARRLTEAKQSIPHFYLTVDCEIDALLATRKELNARADGEFKLSVNDLVIKAVALALRKVPAANASYTDEGIRLYKSADVAVAVASDKGLITPVVRRAHEKGLRTISEEMSELAGKAREGSLKPEEFQGGTFTISNLGMFGVKQFDAVINPPQACILAVGAGEQRPVVKDGALAVATVMTCTLSVDHRAVDGAIGAQFLDAFKKMIQDPLSMML